MTDDSAQHDDSADHDTHEGSDARMRRKHELRMYARFGAMIATSTTVMFLLTYTNSYAMDHVRFSEERVYMALLMGAAMAIIMLGFMWGMMYKNVRINVAIVALALVLGVSALWLSRSQAWVDDLAYMKGMIPHHSIAILTSERADIDDVRVRELADEIIVAQRREIKEMDWLIADLAENGSATTPQEAETRPVPEFTGELDPAEPQ
jgi:hypothetical protein